MAFHGCFCALEIIRFAAANRLCVQLDYRKESGERTHPVIEPYSLRRTDEGNLLLYGVKADTGEDRSYRVDRILNATATRRSFTPKYAVELTSVGPVSALLPATSRTAAVPQPNTMRALVPPRARKSALTASGPAYVFKCTACGKSFRRKSYDAILNKHKNKQGLPCHGRLGSPVKTDH